MKKIAVLTLGVALFANAHFLTFLPSVDNVENEKDKKLELDISFIHPFTQIGMNMEKPKVYLENRQTQLPLTQTTKLGKKAWKSSYTVKDFGVYKFFVEPQPYFEPIEKKFISHVPKIIIAHQDGDGWDEPLGLKYEIIPLTKPFAIYSGNSFTGKVLNNGKAASNVDVEVEFYNDKGLEAPTSSHVTQVVKTDDNGVFTFTVNKKGWWGFAALIEEGELKKDGKNYPIENGALLWIKAY